MTAKERGEVATTKMSCLKMALGVTRGGKTRTLIKNLVGRHMNLPTYTRERVLTHMYTHIHMFLEVLMSIL